jgi:hypothetical protein
LFQRGGGLALLAPCLAWLLRSALAAQDQFALAGVGAEHGTDCAFDRRVCFSGRQRVAQIFHARKDGLFVQAGLQRLFQRPELLGVQLKILVPGLVPQGFNRLARAQFAAIGAQVFVGFVEAGLCQQQGLAVDGNGRFVPVERPVRFCRLSLAVADDLTRALPGSLLAFLVRIERGVNQSR